MKGLLFWKIVIAFWLTFVIVNQGGWIVYMLYSDVESDSFWFAERIAQVQLASAKTALEAGGVAAFGNLVANWPERRRRDVEIIQSATPCPEKPAEVVDLDAFCDDWAEYQVATDPDGRVWQLKFELPPEKVEWSILDAFHLQTDLLMMSTIGALLFAAALAYYLTRPVRRMQSGFEALAAGHLATRLGPAVGRRRDEIADLARDFDRMAERLQQLVQVRDQLLHDVSHELRSPLARLSLSIGLLRQDPANLPESLKRIDSEIRRLDDLVGEMLSLARAESGEARRDQYFDLAVLIDSIVAMAEFEARARNVRVDAANVAGKQGIVLGNLELLRRAIENVVRNAVHVSAAGQTVEITMETDATAAEHVVTVADSGPGVAPAKLESMFDPFVRIEGSASGKGYGLGLAIARRALLALGGTIRAANRPRGGLAVTMRLPAHPFDIATGEPS